MRDSFVTLSVGSVVWRPLSGAKRPLSLVVFWEEDS